MYVCWLVFRLFWEVLGIFGGQQTEFCCCVWTCWDLHLMRHAYSTRLQAATADIRCQEVPVH